MMIPLRWMTLRALATLLTITLLPIAAPAPQSGTKPPELDGTIAFLRNRKLSLMNADGSNQRRWKDIDNVVGRLSWAPDGKRVAFSRRGSYSYQLPDGGGGTHRLYDIFASHIDSARDEFWWWITVDHGSRGPAWSPDGKYIAYARDMNANQVDAEIPDYQIEYRTFNSSEVVLLKREDALPGECQGLEPTWSPDGTQIAFVYHKVKTPTGSGSGTLESIGLVIVPATGIVRPEEKLEYDARQLPDVSGPMWSPDGKSIAYVDTKPADGGIYLVSPKDLTKKRIFEKTSRIIPYQGSLAWSPDSEWIAFASTDGFIFLIDRDGRRPPYRLTSGGNDYFPAFAPK